MSSSGGPTTEIWKKWSITHSEASPHWSASRATARHVAPVEAGASGQENRLTCSPSFMLRTLRGVTAPASGSQRRSSVRVSTASSQPSTSSASCTRSRGSRRASVRCGSQPGCWRSGTSARTRSTASTAASSTSTARARVTPAAAEHEQARHPHPQRAAGARARRRAASTAGSGMAGAATTVRCTALLAPRWSSCEGRPASRSAAHEARTAAAPSASGSSSRECSRAAQRYWPVLATVLIDLPGSVPSLVLMRVRM